MSRVSVVAKRYARAVFELAQQAGNAAQVEAELKALVEAVRDEATGKFLASPNIAAEQKAELFKQAFAGKVSPLVGNTLELLIHRGRTDMLEELYLSYKKVSGEALGQADAIVYTAKSLSADELAAVAAQFEAHLGKKIRAEQTVDASLLGGVKVRIGDRLYDGSLSGKLARLEHALR